ncbi:MAG: hypothetical protein IT449_05015 [Phycisphaerales bacterium]|nr:hypothetical protein [Phycisphaerales bacterium]
MNLMWMAAMIAAAGAPQPVEEVLYDTLWLTDDCLYNNGFGNALSGRGVFGVLHDLRLADDFELERAAVIDSVTADYMSLVGTPPHDGVFVRVYADREHRPQEPPVFERLATSLDFDGQWGNCGLFEPYYARITVTDLSILLTAGSYWISSQPVDTTESGDWFYRISLGEPLGPGDEDSTLNMIGASSHVRDGDLGEGGYGHQDWRSTEEHGYGRVLIAMRLAGHWATVCDRIDGLRAICRRGRLRIAVESSLPEGKRLTILNGQQQRRMTIRKGGRGRVHFDAQVADGEVAIEGCAEWRRAFDCR